MKKKWLIKKEIDIACWMELGLPWQKIRKKDRFPAKMKSNGWDNQCIITLNNIHETSGNCQYGGTATMVFNELTSTIAGTGYDKTGLGRWSWIRFTGKGGVSTCVITAYCPCTGSPNQPSTVYAQQKRYF